MKPKTSSMFVCFSWSCKVFFKRRPDGGAHELKSITTGAQEVAARPTATRLPNKQPNTKHTGSTRGRQPGVTGLKAPQLHLNSQHAALQHHTADTMCDNSVRAVRSPLDACFPSGEASFLPSCSWFPSAPAAPRFSSTVSILFLNDPQGSNPRGEAGLITNHLAAQ